VAQLKNAEKMIFELKRVFFYNDEMKKQASVRAFTDWLSKQIDPWTGELYEPISDEQVYRYISGQQQFPAPYIIPVIRFFQDAKLMSMFNMTPWPGDEEKFQAKLDEAEEDAKKALEKVRMLKSVLRKAKK
jgi:hypothetical protein